MKYYIVDDEIGTIKTLENIVEMRNLGDVIGYSTDPIEGVEKILFTNPEIVLVDLLMSNMDGIALVEAVKKQRKDICFVMLSKVNDKEMIEAAYNAGVEFFINKPINVIEVEKVLKNVADKITMSTLVTSIKGMFENSEKKESHRENLTRDIYFILGILGMTGEKGTADILAICEKLIETHTDYSKETLIAYGNSVEESVKNIEQRMRRAMKKGLNNVANIAINDYGNEVVQTYSNYVFEYKSIKDEMDAIKKGYIGGGRVNVTKFIEGLLLYRESLE